MKIKIFCLGLLILINMPLIVNAANLNTKVIEEQDEEESSDEQED